MKKTLGDISFVYGSQFELIVMTKKKPVESAGASHLIIPDGGASAKLALAHHISCHSLIARVHYL